MDKLYLFVLRMIPRKLLYQMIVPKWASSTKVKHPNKTKAEIERKMIQHFFTLDKQT